ncbi:MAG: permease [Pseudomonadota bacterium]
MDAFMQQWADAAYTSLGFFWMALWAFILGYLISSLIQVLVTRRRMRKSMGESNLKSISLGTFFGFISSSCSFSALATTRALFHKGAAFSAAMAFLLASTNLVIELGFVIAIFLGWQFVIGEYVGGLLLILFAWLFVKITKPTRLIKAAREKGQASEDDEQTHQPGDLLKLHTWHTIAMKFVMEWQMVWKDVLIGFTVAGIISAFVPSAFFQWMFLGVGSAEQLSFLSVLQQTVVGPVAAFFTFIGSMGNIPLAAVLFGEGVAFAGVIAFIFSDLVVLPVLRINARYYGWKMSLYIALMLFVCLVVTAIVLHYGLLSLDLLPTLDNWNSPNEQQHFQFNYGFVLNIIFLLIAAVLVKLFIDHNQHDHGGGHEHHHHDHGGRSLKDVILLSLSGLSIIWLLGGMVIYLLT